MSSKLIIFGRNKNFAVLQIEKGHVWKESGVTTLLINDESSVIVKNILSCF